MSTQWEIGGSEIGAIAGISRYSTPLQAFLRMSGRAPPFCGDDATEWGQRLEDLVAQKYAERHNSYLAHAPTQRAPGPRADLGVWRRASPDRLVYRVGQVAELDVADRGLEVKTAGWREADRWGDSGSAKIPEEYECQCRWYSSILDLDWDLAVLIGGQDYREYSIPRDRAVEDALIEIGERFIREHLIPDVPPPIDGSNAAAEWLQKRFATAGQDMLESTPEIDEIAARMRDCRARRFESAGQEALWANRLKEIIGPARGIRGEWGRILWSPVKYKPWVDWEAVARECRASESVIAAHTKTPEPGRMFRPYFKEDA